MPTSTARSPAWSTTCSTRCTRATPALPLPRRRSACRSRSSCGTSTTSRWPSSTRRSSSRAASGSTTRAASASRVCTSRCCDPTMCSMRGLTIDGDEIEIEASELMGRLFQHEIDHLHGVLMFDRMTPEQRKAAMIEYRRVQRAAGGRGPEASPASAVTRAAPPRRLVYLGTPEMAVPPLRALVDAGFDVALVVTRVDKRRGRGPQLMPSPVKAAALELGLPVAHAVDDVLGCRRRPRRRRRLRAVDQAARARRRADGQPALLAAASLARRSAGRACPAGRRRARPACA